MSIHCSEVHLIDIIDTLSLAGSRSKPNDDMFGLAGNRVWVIDGATSLGDPIVSATSDAAWLAHRASQFFAKYAGVVDTRAMMDAVAADLDDAFNRERERPPVDRWEIPIGAFMMLTVLSEEACEIAWMSDCRAILQDADGVIHSFGATPESEAREANSVIGAALDPAKSERGSEELIKLRLARSRYNKPGGPLILGPHSGFSAGVKTAKVTLKRPAQVLLMTDGFSALELRYSATDAASFIASARRDGLARLALKLREIEERDDPDGRRFPRWKRSDDATAALIALV